MPGSRLDRATLRAIAAAIVMALAVAMRPVAVRADPPEFHAYLTPASSQVPIGETIEISFTVDTTAVQFNGYQVTIQYDPTVLTLLDIAEGDLMTGACGVTFFVTEETDSTFTVTHVLLCGQFPSSIDGPGVLSTYRFGALTEGISPLVHLSDPLNTFADAGNPVNPQHPTFPRLVILHDATVTVGDNAGVAGSTPLKVARLGQNIPNPFNPSTRIPFVTTARGQVELEVFDWLGRRVWARSWADLPAGEHSVDWDATRNAEGEGRWLASGVYVYRLTSPSGRETRKMALIR